MNAETTSTQLTIDHDTQQPVEAKTTTALALVTKSIAEINAVESTIAALEGKYRGVVFPIQTKDGMTDACKARAEIREPRYALQNMQKAAKAPLNELKRSIDEQSEDFIARIAALEGPIHLQITTEETRKKEEKEAKLEAERKRVAALQERIEQIRDQVGQAVGESAAAIKARIQALVAMEIGDDFAELKKQAEGARETTLIRLRSAEAKQILHEEEQLQLAAERERLARDREEQERQQAEQRAELERQEQLQAKERARIAEENRQAQLAREAEERRVREAREAEEQAREDERRLADMRLQEIQGIQHQVMIATLGRAGVRKGRTRECIVDTLAETEAWRVTLEDFGPMLPIAERAKAAAIAEIKEVLARWDHRVEEETRLRAQRDQAARKEEERRERLAAEERRIADERAALEREKQDRMREAGGGAPVGATASESSDSNMVHEGSIEPAGIATSGPDATSLQGHPIDPDVVREKVLFAIMTQRERQISAHGYTPKHDDDHIEGEIAQAAIPYIQAAYQRELGLTDEELQVYWPWDGEPKLNQPRCELLVNAAALLVADIERLYRAGDAQ